MKFVYNDGQICAGIEILTFFLRFLKCSKFCEIFSGIGLDRDKITVTSKLVPVNRAASNRNSDFAVV